MSYVKNIVKKPWGFEYLAYENDDCALWFLYIKHNHQTSMHCHPNKTTGLTVLDGKARVSFLSDDYDLKPMDKIMIRKGLFHSTCATDKRGAWVFEIETPVNKNDLVRLRDSYGREGQPYEDSSFEFPKEQDCLWIEDPLGEDHVYKFANSKLILKKITDVDFFFSIEDNINIVFLKGGILTKYGIKVAAPGDIVVSSVVKELSQVFSEVADDTVVMLMEKI